MAKKTIPSGANRSPLSYNITAKPIGPVCNIRCDYCFYLDKKDLFPGISGKGFAMDDSILKSYTRQYIESQPAGTTEVNFIWQGGEPTLLNLDFFEKALMYQRRFRRPGMKVVNSLQTNGTLMTGEKAKYFADNGFILGLSIDGPEELHNRYRKDREGKGTFRQVMAGLEQIQRQGIEFNTLTVVQNHNAEYPEEVYSFLKEIGSRYMQFIPIVEPLDPPGEGQSSRVSSRTVEALQWGRFLKRVFDSWCGSGDIGNIFVGHFDMLLGLHCGYASSMCVHARSCGRALAMEHNGDLYSCDHFVFPDYYLGNIRREGMTRLVSSPRQRQFATAKETSLSSECLSCDSLEFCYGGCPKNRILDTPEGRQNWLCEGYKLFYSRTYPVMQAMKRALEQRRPPSDYPLFLAD